MGNRFASATVFSLTESDRVAYGERGYRGTSLIRKRMPLGPYSRNTSGTTVVLGGGAFSYERGIPVDDRGGCVYLARSPRANCVEVHELPHRKMPLCGASR